MTPIAKKALEGSIEKWQLIVVGTGSDKGVDNCPLCKEFFHPDCGGCPVSERTGQMCCDGSPYETWVKLSPNRGGDWDIKATTQKQKKVATRMLRFLESLRS